jgi:hypothetical protein
MDSLKILILFRELNAWGPAHNFLKVSNASRIRFELGNIYGGLREFAILIQNILRGALMDVAFGPLE